ncbi:GntR family transcriptional regulator [Aneurinibacillus tyrosinisolvens]|uniref:GntR family transcriptional regulator n=1 Tax=Aneurinibacillus tyrosinisolvens TaxID=1443435 RepID=UPI00063ED4AB|nr:GntR family transcriptional regulator [Aneurinibacillus tyrosinisolvens]
MQTETWIKEELSPIRDKVYRYIKDLILNGELQAGERIVERELADKLNISRTPIREALFRLESQGFVKTLPRKGVVVSRMSTEEIIEIFTILSSLKSLAVKLAASKISESEKHQLAIHIDTIESLLTQETIDTKNVAELLHLEINETIYKAAKSPRLYKMLHSLLDYIQAFATVGQEIPGRVRKSMEEHRDIAMAVRNGESDLAEQLAKIHIANSKTAYLEALQT